MVQTAYNVLLTVIEKYLETKEAHLLSPMLEKWNAYTSACHLFEVTNKDTGEKKTLDQRPFRCDPKRPSYFDQGFDAVKIIAVPLLQLGLTSAAIAALKKYSLFARQVPRTVMETSLESDPLLGQERQRGCERR